MIEQTYKLNMIPRAEQDFRSYEPPVVHISQYDKVLRTLRFELYDGENPFTIPENTAAYIYGMKPDGNAFQYQMDITEDGLLQIDVQTQMATVAGCVTCEVILFEGNESGNRIGSANFKMAVEKAAVGDDAQFSKSDMPVIQTLLFGGTPGDILVKDVNGVKWNSEPHSVGYMRYDQYDPDRTGTVNSARDSETVDGHTVARNVLSDEYTNTEIDGKVQAVQDDVDALNSSAVKSVNTITPVNGNVTLSKADIGLGNVDNTSDADKPISTATQAALDLKVDKVTGKGLSTNDYTDADKTKLGDLPTDAELTAELAGKVDKESGKGLSTNDYTTADKEKLQGIETGAQVNTVLGVKGGDESAYRTGNVNITKTNIGLGNVDNTADTDKPVSTAMQTALDGKVDKEAGKILSSNDFTTAEKEKLAGIAAGAEVNVQANWNESDQNSDAFIQNKPSIPSKTSELTNDSGFVTNTAMQSALDQKVDKVAGKGLSTEDFTSAEKTKLAGIEAGAQVNAITGVKGSAEPSYRSGNVSISKTDIGLGNVDDTSDLDKPVSTAMQTALNQKQNKLTFDTEPTENSQNPVTSGGIFLSQKAQDKKFDTLADLLNAKYADDWATIQAMIQIGYGTKYYPVGTQFTVHHDAYGDVLFDVVQHITPESDALHKAMLPTGKEYGMVLLMHNVIYSTQFDEVEGFYYCENGLTAGTYNVTITRQPWFAGDVGKTFQFTLADDVPAGAILWWDGYNATREGRTVRVFNSREATSAAQTATMTEGNGGTALGSVDGTGNFNIFDRSVLGSNDWEESGVRQWLNADAASDWWEPKTKWDRLVSYHSRPGFLYGFGTDFKNVLVETTHGNRSNTLFDSHGTNKAYSTSEKIFLLCNEEVNLAQEQGIVCGKVFDYYKDAANEDRIKYDITSAGTARFWWLRSPYPSNASHERSVNTSGALYDGGASIGYGVAAACVIG